MKDDEWIPVMGSFLVICLLAILVWAACIKGESNGKQAMQREAIINGVAEWRPDENGNPQFHWKKP